MIVFSRNLVLSAVLSTALGTLAFAVEIAPAETPATQPAAAPASQPGGGEVVATVNGINISLADLDKETQRVQMDSAGQMPPEELLALQPRMRQLAMSDLVNKQLLLQAAASRKMAVTDAEVKAATDEITKGFGPGEDLKTALAQVHLTQAEFIQELTDNLIIQKLFAEETKGAAMTDDDVSKYYTDHPEQFKSGETVSVRHILVKFDEGDDAAKKAEKKKKIDAIRQRLVNGEDFAKVCQETSDDPGSKNNGGLYEDVARGTMVPPFDNAAFTQKVGEIGPVVETTFGYHVLKVEKHTPAGLMPLAQVKDRLKSYLEEQKKQDAAKSYLAKLKTAAVITYAPAFAPATQPAVKPEMEPATQPATQPSAPGK